MLTRSRAILADVHPVATPRILSPLIFLARSLSLLPQPDENANEEVLVLALCIPCVRLRNESASTPSPDCFSSLSAKFLRYRISHVVKAALGRKMFPAKVGQLLDGGILLTTTG